MIFRGLFGNFTIENVFIYMLRHGNGYALAISKSEKIPLNMIQKQCLRLETIGIFKSEYQGRTKIYSWNDKYPFKNELLSLLQKGLMAKRDAEKRFSYYRPVAAQKTIPTPQPRKKFDVILD